MEVSRRRVAFLFVFVEGDSQNRTEDHLDKLKVYLTTAASAVEVVSSCSGLLEMSSQRR